VRVDGLPDPPKGFHWATLHKQAELGDYCLSDDAQAGLTREPSDVPCPYCREFLQRRRLVGAKLGDVARIGVLKGELPSDPSVNYGLVSPFPPALAIFSCQACKLRFVSVAHSDTKSFDTP
jgi:hypothetical protein